jgi:hypothetical protein
MFIKILRNLLVSWVDGEFEKGYGFSIFSYNSLFDQLQYY